MNLKNMNPGEYIFAAVCYRLEDRSLQDICFGVLNLLLCVRCDVQCCIFNGVPTSNFPETFS